MIRNIIFDMDGVLVDSESAMAKASSKALLKFGVKCDPSEFHKFTGMGDRAYVGGVAEAHGVKYTPEMKDEAYRMFCDTAKENVIVLPWSRRILCELKKSGIPFSLASAADRIKVECNLKCLGVRVSDFCSVITGADVKNAKPSPEIFITAAAKSGFIPSETIVCEDSLAGVTAAKAAGMQCIAVTTSFSEDELKSCGADFVCSDLTYVLKIVNSSVN